MKKIKNLLFSEKGMRMVNVLFFLSAFFYRSGLLFIAYIVFILSLTYHYFHTAFMFFVLYSP